MKKLLLIPALLLLSALPANASPDAEACINKLIKEDRTPLTPYNDVDAKASLAVSIQHEGKAYHWIDLSLPGGILRQSEAIIATDGQGHCSMVFWVRDSLATKAEYDAALGQAVNEKFMEAFQSQR